MSRLDKLVPDDLFECRSVGGGIPAKEVRLFHTGRSHDLIPWEKLVLGSWQNEGMPTPCVRAQVSLDRGIYWRLNRPFDNTSEGCHYTQIMWDYLLSKKYPACMQTLTVTIDGLPDDKRFLYSVLAQEGMITAARLLPIALVDGVVTRMGRVTNLDLSMLTPTLSAIGVLHGSARYKAV